MKITAHAVYVENVRVCPGRVRDGPETQDLLTAILRGKGWAGKVSIIPLPPANKRCRNHFLIRCRTAFELRCVLEFVY